MSKNNGDLVPQTSSYEIQLQTFEKVFLEVVHKYGLPSENIFVAVPERAVVFRNSSIQLQLLEKVKKEESIYLTKFLADVASGLFDAALNYLWDETIQKIRKRVIQYDVSYFYYNATLEKNEKNYMALKTSLN
jgi:hypothetical protein